MLVEIKEITDEIKEVVLNRPEKRNALNQDLLQDLAAAFKGLSESRVVILRGEGSVFCSGLDLKEVKENKDLIKYVAEALQAIYLSPCFTICAVQGAAIAGGAGIMMACDYTIVKEGAVIGFPEVKRGIVPAIIMNLLIQKLNGKDVRELLLMGDLINTDQALKMGLINKVVKDLKEVENIAKNFLEASPEAVTLTKELIDKFYPDFVDEQKRAMSYHDQIRKLGAVEEGIDAFLEKRKPKWQSL